MPYREATVEACANIALVKYWGKRDVSLNLPSRGSISITVDALRTRTTVLFDDVFPSDHLVIDDAERDGPPLVRAQRVLDVLRARAGTSARAHVWSQNTFPYSAGLASSASGMAALSLAASQALGLDESAETLSAIARQGSGSAARSLHGGIVEWTAGSRTDGEDSVAHQLCPAEAWEVRVLVAIVSAGEKTVSSTEGMTSTAATSPYHGAWLDSVDADLRAARDAIEGRNLADLGAVSERSCLRMHADMMSAAPGLLYWRGATVELIHCIRALRELDGRPAWFTIDAGPHVKVLTTAANAEHAAEALARVPGVDRVISSRVGGPAHAVPW